MTEQELSSPHLVLIFAQAQAGLGHLRVTDALFHGLPAGVHGILLNSHDKKITSIHRITSIHPLSRKFMEHFQNGIGEEIFTTTYRYMLRHDVRQLDSDLRRILKQHVQKPKTLLIVATHFGLAHQIAAAKEKIEKHYDIRIIVAVVVTDDSPQHIWAVGGADLVFTPSRHTRDALTAYAKAHGMLGRTEYIAAPYMVSPLLTAPLSAAQSDLRMKQYEKDHSGAINVAIPISGAAVQLSYMTDLITTLHGASHRYKFHIVSRDVAFTQDFLSSFTGTPDVEVFSSTSEREVIDMYERLYQAEVIGFDITKPSEQAFKAIIAPERVGGAILLFTDPVGRQERDNIAFLVRHKLIPDMEDQEMLWALSHSNYTLVDAAVKHLFVAASSWRGLRLPLDPKHAARFVEWSLRERLFERMGHFSGYPKHPELSPDGVPIFWKTIADYLKNKPKP